MIKPARLERGMTIGLIAPASAVPDSTKLNRGIRNLKSLGFGIKEGKYVRSRHGFLAANDKERLADLHAMFADPGVDAVMCVRGGYGTGRIAPHINYQLIRQNPKIFIGYSDVTMLNLAIWKKCRLINFNGPMVISAFGKESLSNFTLFSFDRTLAHAKAPGCIWQGHADHKYRVVKHGKAKGRLTGGNLSLVAASIGTPFQIETRGAIVFLEDVDEQPYRFDRMLTQLLQAGTFDKAAAVVFGRNVPDADSAKTEVRRARQGRMPKLAAPPPQKVPRTFNNIIDDVIAERMGGLGIPVLIGLPFGHIDDYATLPIGAMASVDTRTGSLSIDEAVVR